MGAFHEQVHCNLKSFKHDKYVVLKTVYSVNSSHRSDLWSTIKKTIGQRMRHILHIH